MIESEKTPAYSTLNLDVLPQPSFVNSLDAYHAKIDPELLKEIFSSTLEIFFQEDQGPGEGGFDHWEEKNPTD